MLEQINKNNSHPSASLYFAFQINSYSIFMERFKIVNDTKVNRLH